MKRGIVLKENKMGTWEVSGHECEQGQSNKIYA